MTTKTMVYQWGRRISSVPAQAVGEAVEEITRRDGCCQPGALVDQARDAESPLHPLFTWDDGKAAERWRVHEARNAIDSLRVTLVDRTEPVPAFISVITTVQDEPTRGYQPINIVRDDDEMQTFALEDALRHLSGLRKRYAALHALAPVWQAVEEVQGARAPASVAAD